MLQKNDVPMTCQIFPERSSIYSHQDSGDTLPRYSYFVILPHLVQNVYNFDVAKQPINVVIEILKLW